MVRIAARVGEMYRMLSQFVSLYSCVNTRRDVPPGVFALADAQSPTFAAMPISGRVAISALS
jgi:hypothetical protein